MTLAPRWVSRVLALAALGFGLASIQDAGRAIFAENAIPCESCPLLLWFSFIGGLVHLVLAAAVWRGAAWGAALAGVLAVFEGLVLMLFFAELRDGAPYEHVRALGMAGGLALGTAIAVCAWPRASRAAQGQFV